MKDMPQIDSYIYLFVVYLTAMPVVQILSLTQENAGDLRSVRAVSLKDSRRRMRGNDTEPVKNMSPYYFMSLLKQILVSILYAFSFITSLQSNFCSVLIT
jgi:hypothetical protein